MNSKIKNYVEVLFTDIPSTRKSQELKEEILSNLNEHFEEHLREGKSENQAYTEALGDLGDIDELLKDLAPEQEIKEKLDKKLEKGIKIPLIAFTGIKIFSGYGVKVNFKMLEVNKVNSEIRNDFISQGINQTLHRNFIDITVKINLILPLKTKEICINKTILLNESILVGKIPQVYLQK